MKSSSSKHPEKLIKSDNLFPVVGIGASAGGLDAFKKLLRAIPEGSGMAYVLVQHLDPNHESMLPDILQKVTKIPVLEIADDIKVEPDHVYIMPSNKIMLASDGILKLAPRPAKSKTERHLPIDLFFSSLAEVHQSHAIGVVLSGTASDGTLGLRAIKDHGGITFAQDEDSAAYNGMPQSAIQAGVVDFILPPDQIPAKLLEVARNAKVVTTSEQDSLLDDEESYRQIISLLRIRKGTDFTYYKQTTIQRRILRRMTINKYKEAVVYLGYLKENKQEQDLLYQDLLIQVTDFFRDPKTFENLSATIFPLILKNKAPGEAMRVWVAGCSTGQEAYSFAISLQEFFANNSFKDKVEQVQIFATDLSETAIEKARLGVYSKIELESMSPKRLSDFFTKINGSYQVNRPIRDMCVFASHNFVVDPPFGKMDLISCRNVLIYMEPYLQKKALTTFHYALNPQGYLLLGKSETTGCVPELFAAGPKNEKLFTRKDVPGRFTQVGNPLGKSYYRPTIVKPPSESIRSDYQKIADEIILSQFTPAGVIVNETMDIVQYRGRTSLYLEQTTGKPSHNLLVLAKDGLAFELRSILHKAKKEKVPIKKENIPVEVQGGLLTISIEAIPLPNTIEPYYLILFHTDHSETTLFTEADKKGTDSKIKRDNKGLRIRQLEQELAQTREDMRSITEDQEAVNEELQSGNEELLSGSEELQSLNEELETSKEELQSTNEDYGTGP
jgi:two-component system CheB/CheR fusion protein